MRPYAGYRIDYNAFWKYYRESSRVDYSNYRNLFIRCINVSIEDAGIGYCSNHVNMVDKKLTQICKETRVLMLSNGAPDAATKHIIERFKKWIKIYYA